MSERILGLYNSKEHEWEKIAYLHSNSGGGACVNGAPSRLVLRKAGAETPSCDYAIVVPGDFTPQPERYIAVGDGECLLWLEKDGRVSVRNSGFAGVSAKLSVLRPIRAGVLTVSDKGSRGERADTAGPALSDLVEALGAVVEERGVVPDEREEISRKLRDWSDNLGLNLILTTGGTGLSPRDVTPEAIMDVHEKTVPGFGEIMRSRSMIYTPRGFLTRSVAATRGGALIIAFPGSERAVRQCFEAVAPSIRHAVEILCGWDSECGSHSHG
jgi:molybdenum cofactor synthesis domain-containing protein